MTEKFVFLDIDDVVLPHDFPNLATLIKQTGWVDFRKVSHTYMKYVSDSMLSFIWNNFSEITYWLTTWELTIEGANTLFCDKLKLPHLKEIPFIYDKYKALPSGLHAIYEGDERRWWKSHMLYDFIQSLDHTDWKIVWIDNEIEAQNQIGAVHDLLIDHPQIKTVAPYPCLTVTELQDTKDWLDN